MSLFSDCTLCAMWGKTKRQIWMDSVTCTLFSLHSLLENCVFLSDFEHATVRVNLWTMETSARDFMDYKPLLYNDEMAAKSNK